jgi:hypothetical protein
LGYSCLKGIGDLLNVSPQRGEVSRVDGHGCNSKRSVVTLLKSRHLNGMRLCLVEAGQSVSDNVGDHADLSTSCVVWVLVLNRLS